MESVIALGLRVVVLSVFVLSFAAKAINREDVIKKLRELHIPAKTAYAMALGLEGLAILLLAMDKTIESGVALSITLILVYTGFALYSQTRGAHTDQVKCNCFGVSALDDAASSPRTILLRNALLVFACFVLLGQLSNCNDCTVSLIVGGNQISSLERTAAVAILFLAAFQLILIDKTWRLERGIASIDEDLKRVVPRQESGQNVGKRINAIEVLDRDMSSTKLENILANTNKSLMIYTKEGCEPCRESFPFFLELAKRHAEEIRTIVICNGSRDYFKRLSEEHDFVDIYLDHQKNIWTTLKLYSIPTAIAVNDQLAVFSDAAIGKVSIAGLYSHLVTKKQTPWLTKR